MAILAHLRRHIGIYGFLAVWLTAFCFRNAIAERDMRSLQKATQSDFAPFLVESAIMYGYIQKAAAGEAIGGVDPELPAMAGYTVSEQMSLGLEYAGGGLLQLRRWLCGTPERGAYEDSAAESRLVRLALTWHLALVPALVFVLLLVLGVPWPLAVGGALIETFSAAALGRYTGQDLIKGAFAFPFLMAYLTAKASAERRRRGWMLAGMFCAAFLAVASWDASQLLIGALGLLEIIRLAGGGMASRKRRDVWLLTYLALALAAVLLPYNRVHGAFFSPVIQFVLPGCWLLNWLRFDRHSALKRLAVLAALAMTALLAMRLSPFGGNYSHFGELLSAKIRFLNRLPADPTLLTFDQRFLWTPELHSADWRLTGMIFPAALGLLALLGGGYGLWRLARRIFRLRHPAYGWPFRGTAWQYGLLTAGFFITYCLMARFRDLTALFMAVALPLTAVLWMREFKRWRRWIPLLLLLLAAGVECNRSLHLRRGYPDGMNATADLIRYLRRYDLRGQTVLSDMQNSPLLKCYAGAAILIQPKYELPEVRRLMQCYLETFFNGSLSEFSRFCADNKVDWVIVHLPMITTPMETRYSYRYMTATRRLRPDSAAALMLNLPRRLGDFALVELPAGSPAAQTYRIFRFLAPEKREAAEKRYTEALENHYARRPKRAARLIREAYALYPKMGRIYEAYILLTGEVPPPLSLPERAAR